MYKLKLNTDTAWVPHFASLDKYLKDNGGGVRAEPAPPRPRQSDACVALLGDSNFTMFHNQVMSIAAVHGYLQKSTPSDLMNIICRSVTVIEPVDSDDEEVQSSSLIAKQSSESSAFTMLKP
jgi:hypothetical protein